MQVFAELAALGPAAATVEFGAATQGERPTCCCSLIVQQFAVVMAALLCDDVQWLRIRRKCKQPRGRSSRGLKMRDRSVRMLPRCIRLCCLQVLTVAAAGFIIEVVKNCRSSQSTTASRKQQLVTGQVEAECWQHRIFTTADRAGPVSGASDPNARPNASAAVADAVADAGTTNAANTGEGTDAGTAAGKAGE